MFRFKYIIKSLSISLFCLGVFCSSAFAATLIVENGQLMGAENVLVDGSYYNVEFINGSAEQIFSDDLGEYHFAFTTLESAQLASEALFDQVLTGDYDSDPSLVNGISNTYYSYIFTAHSIVTNEIEFGGVIYSTTNVYSSVAFNHYLEQSDSFDTTYNLSPDTSTEAKDYRVYVRWTPVPVPGSLALLAFGLTGIAALRRRKSGDK